MPTTLEGWIASPIITAVFGLVAVYFFIRRGDYRGPDRRINRLRVASIFVLSAGLHSFGAAVFLHWGMFIPLDQVVRDQFGERLCWVMLGACVDFSLRIWDALDLIGSETLRKNLR